MNIHPLAISAYEKRVKQFWDRFDKSSECWLWIGFKHEWGYGETEFFGQRHVLAHRLAWELTNGPIPKGMFVCHRCDVPACANPAHLFLGNNADNMKDMWSKGRGRKPPAGKGEANNRAKITEEMVRELRRLRAEGASYRFLWKKFNITSGMVGHILNGRAWTHVV